MLVVDGAIVVTVLITLEDEAFTVMATTFELDALNVTAPEYAAETESVPTGSAEVEMLAVPPDRVADASRVVPL